jgi:hypothetical protein
MLVFYHLQRHESGIEFFQAMEEDDFVREHIAPKKGIKKSAFYEAISERDLLQLQEIFQSLYTQVKNIVPKKYAKLAELVAVDGSLVDATLFMCWTDYRKGFNKFKAHVGFNVNQGISQKLHLTEGKGGERIKDRGYQDHSAFDQWHEDGSHFVCRIKGNTVKELITLERFEIDSDFFFDGTVLPCQGGQTDRKKGFQDSGATQNGWIQDRRYHIPCGRPHGSDSRRGCDCLQAEMGDREILCLVEKASQRLPSHFSKHLWSYGPDLYLPDHILAHGYLLCRRAWRVGEYEAGQRTEKYDTK